MRDLVLVTAFNRAEMLGVCLEHLSRCSGIESKEVWICEDQHENKPPVVQEEITSVIKHFSNFKHIKRPPHKGPAWNNIFESLHEAQETDARFVYFIEDDAMVSTDFFQWTEQAFKQFQPFVINGDNIRGSASEDPRSVTASYSDCHVHAGCIRRESLSEILRPGRTYQKHWEETLQNYIIKEKKLSILPMLPRAIDCGWYGTNKPTEVVLGSLEEKTNAVRERARLEIPAWSGDLFVLKDRRPYWSTAYKAQAKWGF